MALPTLEHVCCQTVLQHTKNDVRASHGILQEINLMEKLSFDRNIVQFYGAVLSGPAPMLVLEFMEGMPRPSSPVSLTFEDASWYLH